MKGDDPTLDTIWEDMEQFCSHAVHSSAPTETIASDPSYSQMEKKSRVQSDSADSMPSPPGPPLPPPPPGSGGPLPPPPPPPNGHSLVISEPITKVAKARVYRPQKKMNKVNWSKILKGPATDAGVIWQKAAEGKMDTKVDIDPARVEELFAKPEVKQVEDKTKPVEEKGPKDKVCVRKIAIILAYLNTVDTG